MTIAMFMSPVTATPAPGQWPSNHDRLPSADQADTGGDRCGHHEAARSRASTNHRQAARSRQPAPAVPRRAVSHLHLSPADLGPSSGPSAAPPTTGLSPPPDSVTSSSTCAPRCIASPPRSTSCGRASAAAARPPRGEPLGASPASRSAPGHGRRARQGAAAEWAPVPPPAPSGRPGPNGHRAPSGLLARSGARAGPSPSRNHGAQAPPRAARVADGDGTGASVLAAILNWWQSTSASVSCRPAMDVR